jgi:hypothetical protein
MGFKKQLREWRDWLSRVFALEDSERRRMRDQYDKMVSGEVVPDPQDALEILRRSGKSIEDFEREFQSRLSLVDLREFVTTETKVYDEERIQIRQDKVELDRWWAGQHAECVRRGKELDTRRGENDARSRAIQAKKQQIESILGRSALDPYFAAKDEWGHAKRTSIANRLKAKENLEQAAQHDDKAAPLLRSKLGVERANGDAEKKLADDLRSEAAQLIRDADEADEFAKANDPAAVRERLYSTAT